MSIVAAFDRTLFRDGTSKYCVLRMKTADLMVPEDACEPGRFGDNLLRFTAVGYDVPQTDAVKVELDGQWVMSKYGRRFQVEKWREIVPPTLEGIRGYLASGILKGIGERTADAIVQRFGVDSLNILEKQPDKLLEIRGITEERLDEIKAGYAESTLLRDLMTLLAPFKVTPAAAMRIYEHFGPGGVELLRESPYRLCQVSGFGFERVDAIVRKSGGDLHAPMRIQGALFYALERSRSEGGHLYLEAETMVREALLLLNGKLQAEARLNSQQVARELESMVKINVVVCIQGNIYLPHVFAQENETARRAAHMLLESPEPVDLAPVMEYVRQKMSIMLSPKQAEGVEMVFRHNLSIITGGPGTGKSTILKAVIEAYQRLYPKNTIALGAPTGKASRRMAETTGLDCAQTLHSLMGLHSEDSGWRKKVPLEADLIIVDEASMMDMWLAHHLFSRIKLGARLLLVGDADQLESVGAGNVFRELIGSGVVPVTVLDQIFRQAKDSLIAYNARFINEGNGDLYYGRDFTFIRADNQEEAAELVRCFYMEEAVVNGLEQIQILSPFRSRGAASANELNGAIREEVNPASDDKPEVTFGGRVYRVGDRVMQVKNNYDIIMNDQEGEPAAKGVFNGESGVISNIRPGTVTVSFDGRYADYPLESLSELELAYAMTIHKSQGSEYSTVLIPLLTAHNVLLSRNLLYTAVTRAKQRVILVGQKKALYMAVSKSGRGKRNTLLGQRIALRCQELAGKHTPTSEPPERELKNVS